MAEAKSDTYVSIIAEDSKIVNPSKEKRLLFTLIYIRALHLIFLKGECKFDQQNPSLATEKGCHRSDIPEFIWNLRFLRNAASLLTAVFYFQMNNIRSRAAEIVNNDLIYT